MPRVAFEKIPETPIIVASRARTHNRSSKRAPRRRAWSGGIQRELVTISRQLATILEAGISLTDALRIVGRHDASPAMREALALIETSIINGGSVSAGMKLSPRVFNSLSQSIILAGENTGRLAASFTQVGIHTERSLALRNELWSAMLYPLCVLSVAALVSSFLLIFVVPAFRDIFADLGSEIPWITRSIIRLSDGLRENLLLIFALLGAAALLGARILTTQQGVRTVRTIVFSVTRHARCVVLNSLARALRTLHTTLTSGLTVISALDIAAQTAGDPRIKKAFERARLELAEGFPLSQALRHDAVIPVIMIEMLEVGEATGQLDTILNSLAEQFEGDAARSAQTLKQLIEPALLVVLGVIVGGLVLAMYLPIFSMGDSLR